MPTRLDVDASVVATKALGPVSIATDTDTLSSAIDLNAYPGYRVLLVASTGTRTDGTFVWSVVQSSDNSSYTALTPYAGSVAAVSAADTTRMASYAPTKRYIKVNLNSASTTSGALVSAYVLLIPRGGV